MERAPRHSADGRWPADNTTHLRDVGVHQVRAAGAVAPRRRRRRPPPRRRRHADLDEGDLTVLSSWAEALAEAGTPTKSTPCWPTHVAGATWRERLGLEAPSAALGSALDVLASLAGPAAGDDSPTARSSGSPASARRCVGRQRRPRRSRLRAVSLVVVADLAAIDDAIAALEAQRGLLGDAVVDTALEPLLAQRAELVGRAVAEQRKLVTVLFSDLVDFTVLSQRLDAEDVRTVIDAYFLRWHEHIEANGGVVEKFIGDAVMAVFGLHAAEEEDPHRAIRAALSDARRRSTTSTPRSPRTTTSRWRCASASTPARWW